MNEARFAASTFGNVFNKLGESITKLNATLLGLFAGRTSLLPQTLLDQITAFFTPKQGNFLGFGKNVFNNLLGQAAQVRTDPQFQRGVLLQENKDIARQIRRNNSAFNAFRLQKGADLFAGGNIFAIDKAIADARKTTIDANKRLNDRALANNDRLRELLTKSPIGRSRDDISNIVSTVSGDILSTRLNKFGFGDAEDLQSKQVDLLDQISTQLGPGPAQDSYLKQLVGKAGPLVFSK